MTNPDVLKQIMDFESGMMGKKQTIEFFQRLVDSGLAWQLDGKYGCMAQELICQGLVKPAQ